MSKRPTIIFDQQIFKLQQYGGISRYFSKLINGLQDSKDYNVLPKNYFSNNYHLEPQQIDKYSSIYGLGNSRGKTMLINYFNKRKGESIKQIIKKGKFDVFHPTYYQEDFLKYFPNNKPFVLTVYDMIHELYFDTYFKRTHPETTQKSILIAKAEQIIAISENTKNDILTLYPKINPGKISVIHLGYSISENPITKTISNASPNYILYVGNREYYKNFRWMLDAVADFLKEHDILLVCAGGGDFSSSEIALISNYKLQSRVKFVDLSSDTILNGLYRNAFCFIFPSLFEGFGLPVLEAFSNNCPTILTNASCFPEIAGDGALYFDVNNPHSLCTHLTALLNDKDLRHNLITSANERLKNFGWKKMVDQHKEVYESITNR